MNREERLRQELRQNLQRRKQKARGLKAQALNEKDRMQPDEPGATRLEEDKINSNHSPTGKD